MDFCPKGRSFYDQDRNYRNGVRFEYTTPPSQASEWLTSHVKDSFLFPENAKYLATYAAGQNMYTPEDIDVFSAPTDQRPYAGRLYGEISLTGENHRRVKCAQNKSGNYWPGFSRGTIEKVCA